MAILCWLPTFGAWCRRERVLSDVCAILTIEVGNELVDLEEAFRLDVGETVRAAAKAAHGDELRVESRTTNAIFILKVTRNLQDNSLFFTELWSIVPWNPCEVKYRIDGAQ